MTWRLLFIGIMISSCTASTSETTIEKWKNEIIETEHDFANMVQEEGMHKAFSAFAADEAVLMRNNNLIMGKTAITERYKDQHTTGLDWTPEFVDVSQSGDLGYTYGYYTFTYQDSTGAEKVDTGVFHTVWKRQSDGSWKYVWD